MGGDELVPGITEEELREAAMRAVLRTHDVPALAPHEFTGRDWMECHGITRGSAERELDELVEAGTLAIGRRYDRRTGRQVNGYWKVEK